MNELDQKIATLEEQLRILKLAQRFLENNKTEREVEPNPTIQLMTPLKSVTWNQSAREILDTRIPKGPITAKQLKHAFPDIPYYTIVRHLQAKCQAGVYKRVKRGVYRVVTKKKGQHHG